MPLSATRKKRVYKQLIWIFETLVYAYVLFSYINKIYDAKLVLFVFVFLLASLNQD